MVLAPGSLWAEEPNLPEKVKHKLQERLKVLEEILKLRSSVYQNREESVDAELTSRTGYLMGKLSLAQSRKGQIHILEEHVENVRTLEQITYKLNQPVARKQVDYLQAEAARLKAEARLLTVQLDQHGSNPGTHHGRLVEPGKGNKYHADLIRDEKKRL